MTRGMRGGLIAAGCALLIGVPALARAQGDPPATGDFQAVDDTPAPAWHANGTGQSSLTVATGGTVTFHYDSGTTVHNVTWPDNQPASCTGLTDYPRPPGWSGSCRFSAAGKYAFICIAHPDMKGTVVVEDPPPPPAATSTPVGSPDPTPTPPPSGGGDPAGDPPQTTLKGAVTLAAAQRGSRVRGTVAVHGARSRLEVAVFVPRSVLSGGKRRTPVRVGRYVKAAAPAGRVTFSVPLAATARQALRRHRQLRVTVSVALTPPGGHKLTRSLHATLRPA